MNLTDTNTENKHTPLTIRAILISLFVIVLCFIIIYYSAHKIIDNHMNPKGYLGRKWIPATCTDGPYGPDCDSGYYKYPSKGRWMSESQHYMNIFCYITTFISILVSGFVIVVLGYEFNEPSNPKSQITNTSNT